MNQDKQTAIDVRVRYCECDPMGLAHHSVYAVWFEMARTELLRQQGAVYRDLEADGILFVVIELNIRFRRPARYDDVLRIEVRELPSQAPKRVKLHHEYTIYHDQERLTTAQTTLACVNRQGKPMPIPAGLLD